VSYAPPPHPYPYPTQAMAPGPLRRAPEWQRNLVVALTAVSLVTSVAYSLHSLALSRVLTRAEAGTYASDAELDSLDRRGQLIAFASLGLTLLLAVAVITWLYTARGNAELYDGGGFRRSKGWTIGGWICPIVCFWFPYQCMADVWTASTPNRPTGARFKELRPNWVILFWWLAFCGSGLSSWISAIQYSAAETASEFKTSFWFDYIATACDIAAGFSLIYVVLTVTSYQRYRFLQARISHPYPWHQPQPNSY
jgi:hypothetical protein